MIQIMNHVAIMNPKIASIADILSGKKIVESRWSKHKSTPWGKVHPEDTIYFKESGKDILAVAKVDKVIGVENLDAKSTAWIAKQYDLKKEWGKGKNYCTLIFLKNPVKVEPFKINKSGFGAPTAWLCMENINEIKAI